MQWGNGMYYVEWNDIFAEFNEVHGGERNEKSDDYNIKYKTSEPLIPTFTIK